MAGTWHGDGVSRYRAASSAWLEPGMLAWYTVGVYVKPEVARLELKMLTHSEGTSNFPRESHHHPWTLLPSLRGQAARGNAEPQGGVTPSLQPWSSLNVSRASSHTPNNIFKANRKDQDKPLTSPQ